MILVVTFFLLAMAIAPTLAAEGVEPPASVEFSGGGIAAILAFMLSLALEIVPGFTYRWDSLSEQERRMAWVIGGLVVGVALLVLDYAGALALGVPRPLWPAGVMALLQVWVAFAGAGAVTYATVSRRVSVRKEPIA
jgi:hypothetical protein